MRIRQLLRGVAPLLWLLTEAAQADPSLEAAGRVRDPATGGEGAVRGMPSAGTTSSELPVSTPSGSPVADLSVLAPAAAAETPSHARGSDGRLTKISSHLLQVAKAERSALAVASLRTGELLATAELGAGPKSLLTDPITPSASVFKIVTTVALYEKTPTTPRTTVCTRGGLRSLDASHLTAPTGPGVACSSFFEALGRSQNAVYAQLVARYLKPSDLLTVAEQLGYNSELPWDASLLGGELTVPDEPLEFVRAATGFSHSKLSVLGAVELVSLIAYGGLRPAESEPEAANLLGMPLGGEVISARQGQPLGWNPLLTPRSRWLRLMSKSSARRLRDSMEFTVRSGTAREAFLKPSGQAYLEGLRVAAKTGTLRLPSSNRTASWFVGFAPADEPEIAFAVLLHNSDLWYQKASEVGRELLRAYFAER